MFNIGWPELLMLIAIGLVVFGPERLPKAAADAARTIRQLRTMAQSATQDIRAEMGPEMADLDLRSLHPRNIMKSALFDDDDTFAASHPDPSVDDGRRESASRDRRVMVPLAADERPPYDPDAT